MVRREVLYVLPRLEEHESVKAPAGKRHLRKKHGPPTASPASSALLSTAPALGEPGVLWALLEGHHDSSGQGVMSIQQSSGKQCV